MGELLEILSQLVICKWGAIYLKIRILMENQSHVPHIVFMGLSTYENPITKIIMLGRSTMDDSQHLTFN